jgi:cysteine desulfurase / selenocysteine lyase
VNTDRIRSDFPALRRVRGRPAPVYLDSACMSLVPRAVLRAMEEYYSDYPGCAGRSLHHFAEEVTARFGAAREGFSRHFHAGGPEHVVFLRNATEALNLVGQGLPWRRGDRVLVSDQEHNSNLVLWQRLVHERGIRIEILPLSDDGSFDMDALEAALRRSVRLVSLFHVSNLDGRSLPVREIAERAHARKARVLLDGCQAAPHEAVDLEKIGADYYAISSHKMLGPTGTGALLGRGDALEALRPLLLGGETVEWSTLREHELRPPPYRFEAGLQNYAGVIGAHVGLQYLDRVGLSEIRAHLIGLNRRISQELRDEPRIRPIGPAAPEDRPSIFAFDVAGVDPHDVALFLDTGYSVMVRSGMHCVHSWYQRHHLPGNVRASLSFYNDQRDIATFVTALRELVRRVPPRAAEVPTAPAAPGRTRKPRRIAA